MHKLKIQTFNTGLLKVFRKDIVPYVDERVDIICSELLKIDADIICLQEIFDTPHLKKVKEALSNFPFKAVASAKNFFKSPGLVIFSKYEILKTSFTRFEAQQDIENFTNHGYQKVSIKIKDEEIEIYNVHLTAGGLTGNLETKRASKVAIKQFEQILKDITLPENTFLIGDFNCGPRTDNDTYQLILKNNFYDVLKNQNLENYLSWDNQNTLVARQNFEMPSDRIDHLFLHQNSAWRLESCEQNLNPVFDRIPYNLSDHYGFIFKVVK